MTGSFPSCQYIILSANQKFKKWQKNHKRLSKISWKYSQGGPLSVFRKFCNFRENILRPLPLFFSKIGVLINFSKFVQWHWQNIERKKEAVQNLLKIFTGGMMSIGAANAILSQDSRRMSTSTIRQFMTKWSTYALNMIMRQYKRAISTSISSLSTKESSTPALNVSMRPQ